MEQNVLPSYLLLCVDHRVSHTAPVPAKERKTHAQSTFWVVTHGFKWRVKLSGSFADASEVEASCEVCKCKFSSKCSHSHTQNLLCWFMLIGSISTALTDKRTFMHLDIQNKSTVSTSFEILALVEDWVLFLSVVFLQMMSCGEVKKHLLVVYMKSCFYFWQYCLLWRLS